MQSDDVKKRSVLIIEDDPDDVYLAKQLLNEDEIYQYETHDVSRIKDALDLLREHDVDTILLDLGLPDSRGLETLDLLVAEHLDTPIVVLTGVNDRELGESAIKHGAEDYLPKQSLTCDLICRAIAYSIERHRLITELRTRAEQDPLTGLPNRSMIYDKLEFMINQSERSRRPFALVMLDMDKFKAVNDTRGHRFGDALLKAFAHRIRTVMRRSDYVARYGGDEFFMIVANYNDHNELQQVMQRKQKALSEPYKVELDGEQLEQAMSVSIGVIEWEPGLTSASMLEQADQAMYSSKRKDLGSLTFV